MKPTSTARLKYPETDLVRQVTDRERENYERDGAAILKRVIPLEWVEYMRAAVDRLLKRSDQSSQNYADEGQPRFFAQAFPWLSDDAFKAWALQGPLKQIARQVMPSVKHVNFFYDQIFVKEPGGTTATPWHQDFPYLPISGDQILRIWVPFDSVSPRTPEPFSTSRGSHKWGVVYHPTGFKAISEITDAYRESTFQDQPDFDAEYDTYDWLTERPSRATPSSTTPGRSMVLPGTPPPISAGRSPASTQATR